MKNRNAWTAWHKQQEKEKLSRRLDSKWKKAPPKKEITDNIKSLTLDKVKLILPKPMHQLHIRAQPAPRLVDSDRYSGRDAAVRYFAYKDALRAILPNPLMEDEVYVIFLFKVSESWSSKKKEEHLYTKHQFRPDTDNLLKALKDTFMKEDSHVFLECAAKYWAADDQILIYRSIMDWYIANQKIQTL